MNQPRRQLWVLAGGNGAGKSTFYQQFLAPRGLPFVNADLIARKIRAEHPESVSYEAARLAATLRTDLLRRGGSFCFETVFSHPSKVDFLAEAKAHSYQVVLVYIHLDGTELNLARVAQRVSEGGHNVPADKVVSRIPRTMHYIQDALPLVDLVRLYDNSSYAAPFRTIAHLQDGTLRQAVDPLPPWAEQLLAGYP